MLRRCKIARLSAWAGRSRAGRHSHMARAQELVYRNMRPLVQTVRPPAPRIIQNTVHQTVVHLHQTNRRDIRNHITQDGRGNSLLLVRHAAPAPDGGMDESRPALTARRMIRILSAESARQTLRPFYRKLVHELLDREREEYRGKPAQSLLLVQRILGRRQTTDTLLRLCRQTAETLEGGILHRIRFYRYARHELAVPEDLRHLPTVRQISPSAKPPPEPEARYEPGQTAKEQAPPSAGGLRLSAGEFQRLVQGVADTLDRRSRLESLCRGGM